MPCDACHNDPNYTSIILNPANNNGCTACEVEDCPIDIDAACVLYTGPALLCTAINTDLCLETVIQKFDEKLCSLGAGPNDYLTYELSCLRSSYNISTAKEFAESVSDYVCQLDARYTISLAAIGTRIDNMDAVIGNIIRPGISGCVEVGIVDDENLPSILLKLTNASCDLYQRLNPAAANWNKCFTLIGNAPKTMVEGFNKVIDYICSIQQGAVGNLPVFSNAGTCLEGGNADSLQDTILKMRDRLCQSPSFYAGNLASQKCVAVKANDSLESVISAIITQVSNIGIGSIRGVNLNQFTVSDIDVANPCAGKKLSLNDTFADKKVAINDGDTVAGTLSEKLIAGSNIALDISSSPGKMIISSAAGAVANDKVKASSTDPLAGYLSEKITGTSGTADVKIATNLVNNKVQISANVDYDQLVARMLDSIETDPELKKIFCELVRSCPSPCDGPSNVQIVLA